MGALRLEPLSAKTARDANSLSFKPGQEQFVQPVTHSMAESDVNPTTSWPRVVLDEGKVVGFIVGNFDPDAEEEYFRSCIWRINVSAEAQGRGVGKFAVLALAEEARTREFNRLTVIWESGEDGPGAFFEHIGFVIIGQTQYGENIGALEL